MPRKNKQNKNEQKAIAKIVGQGGYYSDRIAPILRNVVPKGTFAKAGGQFGQLAGTHWGGAPGGAVGSYAGKALGSQISRILGFGDYTVQENTLMKSGHVVPEGTQIPSFGALGHETRIQHREFIQDIVVPTTPTAFTNNTFTLNPGNNHLFPWLAAVASQYQQYKLNGCVFEYRTMSSDITAGGALGTVIMSSQYDVLDVEFSNKVEMENSQYAVSTKPSNSMIHAIECAPDLTTTKLLYVRGYSGSSASDARFYDLATLNVATQGLPGSAGETLGELWVTYDISLYKPVIDSAQVQKIAMVAGSKTSVFGTNPILTGGTFCTATTNTITFLRPGLYSFECYITGTLVSVPALAGTASSTLVTSAVTFNGLTEATYLVRVDVTATGQTVIFDASANTAVTNFTVWMQPTTAIFA